MTELARRLGAAGAAAGLLLVGCAGAGATPDSAEPRTGPPADHADSQTQISGPPADTYGTLRVKQIRRLLLTEDEMFVRAEGRVVEYLEAETVLHRWRGGLIPEDDDVITPCAAALRDLYTASQANQLLALMFVHGHTEDQQPEPADLAVGIASYQQPAQVQPEWEGVAESCHGDVVVLSGQEYETHAFRHSGAVGLSFTGAAGEHHILGLDNGHNAVTVYVETGPDHATALLDRQLAKLGIE